MQLPDQLWLQRILDRIFYGWNVWIDSKITDKNNGSTEPKYLLLLENMNHTRKHIRKQKVTKMCLFTSFDVILIIGLAFRFRRTENDDCHFFFFHTIFIKKWILDVGWTNKVSSFDSSSLFFAWWNLVGVTLFRYSKQKKKCESNPLK